MLTTKDAFLYGKTEVAKAVSDADVRSAFYAATRTPMTEATSPSAYVEAVLIDEGAVVVCEGEKKYKVPFTLTDGEITFQRDKAVEVALTWAEKRAISKRDPWLVGGKSADKAEQRYTLGVVYAPGEVDAHGDTMSEAELEKAAWAALGTEVGIMHRPGSAGAGKVVESYIHRGKAFTMKDVGGKPQEIPVGAWMLGVVWNEDAWAKIVAGEIRGYSLQGVARGVEPDEDENTEKGTRKSAGSLFANIVFGVTPRTQEFDPADLQRTDEDTFSPASAADRQEQERVGRALTDMAQDTEAQRGQPRVSFANLFVGRE